MAVATKFSFHPACLAAPEASPEEYQRLKDDIAAWGVIEPVVIHKGKVLDGRHRIRACEELGIEVENILHDDELREHGGDPWAFVWSSMQRKNLSTSQLSMFAAERLKQEKPKAKERQVSTLKKGNAAPVGETLHERGRASDKAAEAYGISGRTVAKAANVAEQGCKQLQKAVRDGKVNVTLAEQVAKALPKDKQQEVVATAMLSEKPEKVLREAVSPKSEPKRFPLSDQYTDAAGEFGMALVQIDEDFGGCKKLFANKQWDGGQTSLFLSQLSGLHRQIGKILKEAKDA